MTIENPLRTSSGNSNQGKFIRLLPLVIERDLEALFSISHGTQEKEQLWKYLPFGPFPSAGHYRETLKTWEAKPDLIAFTVTDVSGASVLGSISLMSIRAEHACAELGKIWYTPMAQRTKTNTEACFLLLRYCFDILGYRRMEWKCDALNEPSKTAALRLGFVFEGIFRQHLIVKGLNRDTAWFSMLDSEWPAIRAGMEKWLYAGDGSSLNDLICQERSRGGHGV